MHQSKEQKLKLTIVILSVLLAISLTALLFVSSMLHHPHTTSTTPNNIIAAGQTASTYITTAAKPLSASREIHATTLSSRKTSNSQSETLKLNRTHTTDNVPFNVSNMFPGDQTTNEFCVRVSYNEPATLHFLATVQPGYEKLAEVMKLRISVDGQTEYDGLLRNAWITTSVEPGLLYTDVEYTITAYLDTSVGNEYQDKALMSDFVWWLETDDSAGPAMYPYFVQYIDKDTGDHLMEEKKVYAPYGIEVTEQAPVIPGYTPDAESKTITIKVEGNTITFYYEREEGVPDEPSVPPDDPGEYPPDDPGAEPSEKPGSVQTGNDLRESNTLPIIYSLLAIACVLGILLVIFFRTAETRKKKGNNDVR